MTNFEYMLAPLEDYTGSAFRALCYKYGADLTFTEMIRVGGLARNNKSTWKKLNVDDETPTVVQLLVAKDELLNTFLKEFSPEEKGFRGFNLNIGCPSPQVINIGQGAALIKRINKVKTLTNIIRDHGYPVSVKMRLGLNNHEKRNKVYLNLINGVDADFFVLHARHAGQTYADKADWNVFEECANTGRKIIANGDIKTKDDILRLKDRGVKGAMIGRAAITNPLIFNQLKGEASPDIEAVKKEFFELSKKFNTDQKFVDNVFKFLGKQQASTNSMVEHLSVFQRNTLLAHENQDFQRGKCVFTFSCAS